MLELNEHDELSIEIAYDLNLVKAIKKKIKIFGKEFVTNNKGDEKRKDKLFCRGFFTNFFYFV